jgi:propanol-preferring alcohol dehydrogenase
MGPLGEPTNALHLDRIMIPKPAREEVLVRVQACGVCHTEIDEIEGRTPPPRLPVIPGHQVVGEVVAEGPGCLQGLVGKQIGVAWIHSSCGDCGYCQAGLENLCEHFQGCGRDADGGYAEYMAVREAFAHDIPVGLDPLRAAPLLCAGAVGLRAIRLCGLTDGEVVGLTGFGASGHLVLQMLRHLFPSSDVMVFARSPAERAFALELGADWAGDTMEQPPVQAAAIIDTTPAWKPVIAALAALQPAGRLVINAIAKEAGDLDELLSLSYQKHLWREKSLRTVTNVTRADVRDCLALGAKIPLVPEITEYRLEDAPRALLDIRGGAQRGARVLRIS